MHKPDLKETMKRNGIRLKMGFARAVGLLLLQKKNKC